VSGLPSSDKVDPWNQCKFGVFLLGGTPSEKLSSSVNDYLNWMLVHLSSLLPTFTTFNDDALDESINKITS